jgi:uncharacterized protein (TIGR03437 family)
MDSTVGNSATDRVGRWAGLALLATALPTLAQTPPSPWRHVGTSAVELGLAGLATGPVERVWYDRGSLRVLTGPGAVFETRDLAHWDRIPAEPPAPVAGSAPVLPEPGARVLAAPSDPLRVYAWGRFVYRSEDGGRHWENTTAYKGRSIVGEGLRDLAVAPANADEVVVAGAAGVFRSADGGASWHGLNDQLPNLPGGRLLRVPPGEGGAQIELRDGMVLEWLPGEREAWRVSASATARMESALRAYLSEEFGVEVTAVAVRGNFVYAGDVNGRLSVSADGLRTWLHSADPRRGRVNAFWVHPEDGRVALAVLDARPAAAPPLEPLTILHTVNAGGGWDLVSTNLPAASLHAVTAEAASDTVYAAGERGVFTARLSLRTFGAAAVWSPVGGLPAARVTGLALDAAHTQLWAVLEGLGVYATLAPHRRNDPRVVSAADLVARAAAPGALLSVAGARVETASAGGIDVPVLASGDAESQIQIPFNASAASFALTIRGPQGARQFAPVPLQPAAPAIFEVDGSPLVLDADRGVMLDGNHPAQSRMRVQILASGLGRVRPEWPAGVPAPADNVPQVVAPVRVYFDREPVEVLRAVLAPGYTGVYLVEVELPALLYSGLAELYLDVAGHTSNRVWIPIAGGV